MRKASRCGDSPIGEPDAGNPPVRFGGRGGLQRPSLPLSNSSLSNSSLPIGFGRACVGLDDAARPMCVNDGNTIQTRKGIRVGVNERSEGGVGMSVDPGWAPDPKT